MMIFNFLLDNPLCEIILSNLWEDDNDINDIYDPLCSLDDKSLCGVSIENYDVEFASNA